MKHSVHSFSFVFLFGALPSLLVIACGSETLDGGSNVSSPHTAPRYACDNRAIDSTCADFPSSTTRSEAESSCDGTVVETSCPVENAVGKCTVSVAKGELTNSYYSDGREPRTEVSARERCDAVSGAFRAP